MTGIELITEERREQIEKHRRSVEWDLIYNKDEQLVDAAWLLIIAESLPIKELFRPKDWNEDIWLKMVNKSPKERYIIAASLLAAEIDRLNKIKENEIEKRQEV